MICFVVGFLCILPFQSSTSSGESPNSPVRFYAGVFFLVMGSAYFFPASNTIFSLFSDHPSYIKYTYDNLAFWTSLNNAFGSLGRFLGPALFSVIVTIQKDTPQCNYRDSEHYSGQGCSLNHQVAFFLSMIGFALVSLVVTWFTYTRSIYAHKK